MRTLDPNTKHLAQVGYPSGLSRLCVDFTFETSRLTVSSQRVVRCAFTISNFKASLHNSFHIIRETPPLSENIEKMRRPPKHEPQIGNYFPTFKSFPTLPYEIRYKIWFLALPGPRIIRIKSKELVENTQRGAHRSTGSQKCGPKALAAWAIGLIPVLLHINYESRLFAKRYYTLSFERFLAVGHGPIWFDWERDVLYFRRSHDMDSFYTGRHVPQKAVRYLEKNLKNLMVCKNHHTRVTFKRVFKFENLSTLVMHQSPIPHTSRNRDAERLEMNRAVKESLEYIWALRHGVKREALPAVCFISKKEMVACARVDYDDVAIRRSATKNYEKVQRVKKIARSFKSSTKQLWRKLLD